MNRRTRLFAGFLVLSVVLSRTSSILAVESVGEIDASPVIWSQPPIEIDPNLDETPVLWGWDEPARSTTYEGQRRQWRMDADDFRGLGAVPVKGIRWWGGYKAWASAQPPAAPQPTAWHVGIWANMVEGLEPNDLCPERLVWSVEIPGERVRCEAVGLDRVPGRSPEMCFACEVGLESEEWFHPAEFSTNEGIFWISITAVYPTDVEAINMWGWRTRPHLWGNGAVMPAIMGEWPTHEERLFPGRIYPIENSAMCGAVQRCDLCFELLTDESCCMWDQPYTSLRDWPDCAGRKSVAAGLDANDPFVLQQVADDWTCDGVEPVVAVAWYGSYFGYSHDLCGGDGTMLPRRPDSFLLSIWSDRLSRSLEQGDLPGEKVWEYEVVDYDEVLVGRIRNGVGDPNESVFRYCEDLPEHVWFQPQAQGGTYWLSVVAVFDPPLDGLPYVWGWADRRYVFGLGALTMDPTHPMPKWTELADLAGEPVDMSFTLFMAPELGPVAELVGD